MCPTATPVCFKAIRLPWWDWSRPCDRSGACPKTKKLVAKIRKELAGVDIPLVLCPADGPLAESHFLDVLRDRRLGALIVTAAHVDDPDLVTMARQGYAVIAVGDLDRDLPKGIVAAEADEAARTVAAALGWTPKNRADASS